MKTPATPPRLSLHQLSLYNAGRMSSDHIIAAFAVRRQQFDRLVADIAAEGPQSRAQHHLIVGQRGMGKTMLLARIAAEIRTRPDLAAHFVPLVFAEEQYAVDRLSKFWLNCLDSLADARELSQDEAAVDAIDATVARLQATGTRSVQEDQTFADEVYAAFKQAVSASGQRAVLLVDNLQLVFERLDKGQQHSLRELLMRPGSPILVGASPSPPPESQDYGAAFYDHFKVHYLRPLSVEEMRDLLLHLAGAAGRDDVRQRVLQYPARLTVLRQLTGGNPRTTLTLFFLYAEDFSPSVFGDLEGLLDRVTPLYKSRFEELTQQQQVIVSAIANHWDPATAGALVTATSLPAGTVSAQLDRLEKTGVVERTELFGDTRTGYQLAERFFNIWFLMRSASRRQRREVEFLTRFLENFYEPADRSRLATHLHSERDFSADRHLWARALARTLEPAAAHDLQRHAELDALRQKEATARRRLDEVVDFASLRPCVLAFADLREKLEALVPPDAAVTPEDFADEILGDRKMFSSGDREKLASRASLSNDEMYTALDSVEASRSTDSEQYGDEAVDWLSKRLSKGQLAALDDMEDWNATFRLATSTPVTKLLLDTLPDGLGVRLAPDVSYIIYQKLKPAADATFQDLYYWVDALIWRLENFQRGEAAVHIVIAKDGPQYIWSVSLGFCLKMLGRYDEALTAYQTAVSLESTHAVGWSEIANLLQYHLGRYDEAEPLYRKSIELDGSWAHSWNNLGNLLARYPERRDEAEAAYKRAVALDEKEARYWSNLGLCLRDDSSRLTEAEDALKQAITLNERDASHWINLGYLYYNFLSRPVEATAVFTKASELDPTNQDTADALLFLHRDYAGEGIAAEPRFQQMLAHLKVKAPETDDLHKALFAAYAKNWGLASEALEQALRQLTDRTMSPPRMTWLRASAVLLHLNYGAELLAFLDGRGDTARLRPWVEALRAHQQGDRRALQNIAPEIRTTAEVFYDDIENILKLLPEKTRRRPLPNPKDTRRKKHRPQNPTEN